MMTLPMVRHSIFVQTLVFTLLFSAISLIQPTFDLIFERGDQFAIFFFAVGAFCASSSLVNAIFVMRYGMRAIISLAIAITLGLTAIMLVLSLIGLNAKVYFWVYVVWQGVIFYQMGLTIGNLNALAMEPLGHIAGLAASVMGAISTISAGILATLIAQLFNQTTLPQIVGSLIALTLAVPSLIRMRRLDRPAETSQR